MKTEKRQFWETTIHVKVYGELPLEEVAKGVGDIVETFNEEGILAVVHVKSRPMSAKRAAKMCSDFQCGPDFIGLDVAGRSLQASEE